MIRTSTAELAALYLEDETAWLERMAELVGAKRLDEIDCENLQEFLTAMANRDRREVRSRLVQLMAHRLKWEHQPAKRTRSWVASLVEQRRELRGIFESRTLRNHARAVFDDSYRDARRQAEAETGLPLSAFPELCDWTLDELIADRVEDLPPN